MSNDLKVRILGDDSDLQGKLRSSASAVAKWGAAAVAAGAAATAALVKSGLESADALAKEAQQLNTTSKDLAIMQRAADMAGVSQEKLASASRALTTRLAQAAAGTGTAGEAIKALGLSMEDLDAMSMSERVATINAALKDNVSANEAAAYAAQLFGEEAALAVSKIDSSVIATATEDVNVFNAALSDVDAAKIENANDAISRLGLAYDSVTTQLAAEFAPILNQVADDLFDAAKESEIFQKGVQTAMGLAVGAVGYLANAIRGVQLAFKGIELVVDGVVMAMTHNVAKIVEMWDMAIAGIADAYNAVIRTVNNIPGINLDEIVVGESELAGKLRASADEASAAYQQTKQEIVDLFNEELPSTGVDKWFEETKKKYQELAEMTVAGREDDEEGSSASGESGSDKESPALQKAREEAQKKLDLINESFKTEEELRAEQREAELEALQEALDLNLLTEEEALEKTAALKDRYKEQDVKRAQEKADAEERIEKALQAAKLSTVSDGLGMLAGLMNTKSRSLFEIGKAAAMAQATVDGYAGIQKTLAAYPAPFNYALAAAQGIVAAQNVASIASTSFGSKSSVTTTAASGNASSAALAATSGEAQTSPQQNVAISLTGDVYSRQSVTQLIEQINEAVSDGARIRVA